MYRQLYPHSANSSAGKGTGKAQKGKAAASKTKAGSLGGSAASTDPKHRVFPISGTHSIDLKYMVMYEAKNPANYQKIYRSKLNTRVKPINEILKQMKKSEEALA